MTVIVSRVNGLRINMPRGAEAMNIAKHLTHPENANILTLENNGNDKQVAEKAPKKAAKTAPKTVQEAIADDADTLLA